MSSSQTPNYHLSQWDYSDRILMDEFNSDNSRIDQGIREAWETADSALSAANIAKTSADSALGKANSASTAASTAQSAADSAATAASKAQTTANTAVTNAATAQTAANNAATAASRAQTTANNAATAASNAQTTANNALAGNNAYVTTYVGDGTSTTRVLSFSFKPSIVIIHGITNSDNYWSRTEILGSLNYGHVVGASKEGGWSTGRYFAVSWSGNKMTMTIVHQTLQNEKSKTYTVVAIR